MAKYYGFNDSHLLQKMRNSGALIKLGESYSPMPLLTEANQPLPPLASLNLLGLSGPFFELFLSSHVQVFATIMEKVRLCLTRILCLAKPLQVLLYAEYRTEVSRRPTMAGG